MKRIINRMLILLFYTGLVVLFSYLYIKIFQGNLNQDINSFGKVLIVINIILSVILSTISFMQNVYMIVGIFGKAKRYKETTDYKNYAYLICAHNEDSVIGNLIDSILKQDYPKDKMHIFVCADNCTDNTVEVCRKYNCNILERNNLEKSGKSYALDELIKHIFSNYANLNFDGFIFFDADNLVDKKYTKKINDAFNSGFEVVTSFRGSKNFDSNLVSAGSSMTFYREAQLIHLSRSRLGIGTYVSGTGFLVSNKLLTELGGWPYHLLIEDIEFSINCANKGIKIGYCHDAIFYDEQPTSLKLSTKQRLRWCKGNHQCFAKYYKDLIKGIFGKGGFISSEMLIHVTPLPIISFSWVIINFICISINNLIMKYPFETYIRTALIPFLGFFVIGYLLGLIHAIVTYIRIYKRLSGNKFFEFISCFYFPIYLFNLLVISGKALFVKVKWEKIPHNINKKIDNMNE